ncbi:MAG: isoprenyl transferase [bacterium]|nr:MAG: isoprenyl transferase [bacterium]
MELLVDEENELKQRILENGNIPVHVAIIMDGNGRWAKARNLSRIKGHEEGINSVRAVVEASGELGIEVLTLYTFSKENWRRPKAEIAALWRLLIQTVRREVPELKKNNVRLNVIGVMEDLPRVVFEGVEYAINQLKDNTGLIVNLALSYSSRYEITQAIQRIAGRVVNGEIKPREITEQTISDHLYTANLPDPDLVIRTSGEQRISNFLLWQIAYSELYISNVLWPDFRKKEFYQTILAFQKRERRYGMVSEQVAPEFIPEYVCNSSPVVQEL